MELVAKLRRRQSEGNPVRVGIIGCGQMGSGLAHAVHNVMGMEVRVLADLDVERGVETFREMGIPREAVVVTASAEQAQDATRAGKMVVTPDALLPTRLDAVEANVEVTGVPDIGARVAWTSIQERKPIVMMNVETDITIGPLLGHLARRSGGLYTVASGDEPGVCKMLHEQALLMGFEVVCLGKGKNNPIRHDATPSSCAEEASSKGMNPKILASFVDGTKTMVEMAAVSNATGLLPDRPGMHGPRVELDDLVTTFIPRADGGIFERRGAVDYSTGTIAPGVYAVVFSDDSRVRKDMKFITRADGPYYLHFRPYHLCDLETPQSIAEAVLLGEVTVAPETMRSDVVCTAKRDLRAGERVEGIGGADWYGTIYTYREARELRAIPIGIAAGGRVTRDVKKGALLTEESLAPETTTFIYRLRQLQESLIDAGTI